MSLRLVLFSLMLVLLFRQKTARPIRKLTFEKTNEMVSFSLSTRKMHQKNFMMEFENEKSAALSLSLKNFITV